MANVPGTTRAQTLFLRSFAKSPHGPSPDQWPSPAVLRRWMRRPRFRTALQSLRDTYRFEADLQLARAASITLHKFNESTAVQHDPPSTQHLREILRLSHARQRFAPPDPAPQTPPASRLSSINEPVFTLSFIKSLHPNCSMETMLDLAKSWSPESFEENPGLKIFHDTRHE